MVTAKYYARIRALAAAPVDLDTFDFSVLGKGGGIAGALVKNRTVHAILRAIWPVGRIGKFGWVVRHADVAEVRRRKEDFLAPYGEEMVQLTGGYPFVLGMPDGDPYRRQLAFMRAAIRPEDISEQIAPNARELAKALIAYSGGELDAVQDLLFRVAAETCADYFGLEIDDPTAFSQWLMSLSTLLFADYFGNASTHQLALAGAARLRRVIDTAIIKARAIGQGRRNANIGPEEDEARARWYKSTVIGRLMALQLADAANGPSDAEIRAIIMGTAVGYVPTGGGAGGNILDVLLDRPEWLAKAHTAAIEGRDADLGKILGEAMRFSPPINPGLPRYIPNGAKVGGTTFPQGSTLIAASMAAMFDGSVIKDPDVFNPDRDLSQDLQFGGDYLHWCFGEHIARALLLETFKPLLAQVNLRRARGKAGRRRDVGPFPQHLGIAFDPKTGHRQQSMVTICIPVTEPVPASELNKELDKLGNPAKPALQAALNDGNVIQFAHISALEGERDTKGRHLSAGALIVELTGDGDPDHVIDAFVDGAGAYLLPVFTLGTRCASLADLKTLLRQHHRKLIPGRLFPSRSTASGVNFPGTPELSVDRIDRDRDLAREARLALDRHLASRKGRGGLASPALASVRAQIRAGAHRADLARPASQGPAVSRRADRTLSETLKSLSSDPSVIASLAIVLVLSLLVHFLLDTRTYSGFHSVDDILRFLRNGVRAAVSFLAGGVAAISLLTLAHWIRRGRRDGTQPEWREHLEQSGLSVGALTVLLGIAHLIVFQNGIEAAGWQDAGLAERFVVVARVASEIVSSLVVGLLVLVVGLAIVISALLAMLRRSETNGAPQDLDPPFEDVKALLRRENQDGYVQNHIVAVTQLKTNPRWLRRFTLGLAFWGIQKLVQHRFRPGFVLDLGTIHYARWFRLPGADKLIFFSNYDGSWESYLEDFITKAHLGQTAVWSNGVGFPKTSFLLFEGATDGARFKRWVRRQQVESRFWYSRFPDLTTDQMRSNALICEGLAKARTESEAQAWLDLFGSQPRPKQAMEYDEVQSTVFSGMKTLRACEVIPVRVPDDNKVWPDWLLGLIGAEASGSAKDPAPVQISFGETPPTDRALTFALSPEGLKRFGLDTLPYHQAGQAAGTTLGSFPAAFLDGMASEERARILGDRGESYPANWPWAREASTPHAVLIVYARDTDALNACTAALRRQLTDTFGFIVLDSIRTEAPSGDDEVLREPFGFRDGISQPIIRGSRPIRTEDDAIHVVEPGEFVLGYPDNRGDLAPSPVVAAAHDPGILPNFTGNLPDRFPEFAGDAARAPRDFGRNGSFLVIRQLEQDVSGFHAYSAQKAIELRAAYPDLRVDAKWVEAKLMGRWHDGSSLVRHPLKPAGLDRPENDFLFGVEDPQGLRCPYGAHVRRALPRDSLAPGNPEQIGISNRHRLMRRGRPYVEHGERGETKGILFMCLNVDLERQFEFVQQTWITSPTFHGLANEPDPVASTSQASVGAPTAAFTIPHSRGPITLRDMQSFVTVRNGGYFFVPSWSALRFLATLPPVKQKPGGPISGA